MRPIHIALFGDLKLQRQGEESARFPSQKAGLLLAYLTLKAGKPQPRERLIDLFWPEAEREAGRNNLSTILSLLRRLLERDAYAIGTLLKADRQSITLCRESLEADVWEFEALRERAARTQDAAARLPLLQRAAALAEEEFLPGVYEEWALQARDRYSEHREQMVAEIAALKERSPNVPGALGLAPLPPINGGLGGPIPSVPLSAVAPPAPASPLLEKTFANPLPTPLSRFFGREQEQADVADLLLTQKARLVTLLGAGGAGKTRLSLQIGHRLTADFEGRVFFVSLADIVSPLLMPVLLLNALQLPIGPGDPLEKAMHALSEKPSLLILDNMEHLLTEELTKSESPLGNSGRTFVKRLLEGAPALSCLVTSRQALHLDGEQEYYLPPLALPAEESLPIEQTLTHLRGCASVALYVDRAQKAKADFALTAQNAAAVAALCRKLEGMPLALEMAAAWIKTVPPARMRERLEHQLEALVSRRRDLPARQRSLRATCEWSYDLLPPDLQNAFVRLSVFQGGWTSEAATALLGGDALTTLAELQERSLLLLTETDAEEPRYRMLEPLREFAAEKLDEKGEREKARRAHAFFFLALAETAREGLGSPDEKRWIERLKCDMDNLRAALGWCELKDGQSALILVAPVAHLWSHFGAFVEGSEWCARILDLPEAQERTPIRARALNEAGYMKGLQTDYPQANAYHQEALTIYREYQDKKGEASALHNLGRIAVLEHRHLEAKAFFCQALEIHTAANEERGIAACLHGLGNVEILTENYAAAQIHLEQALAIRQRLGDELRCAYVRGALAQAARGLNQNEEALRHYEAVLVSFHRAGVRWLVALTLEHLSEICEGKQKWFPAICLRGAANALREATGFKTPPANRESHSQHFALLQTELGEKAYAEAWKQGVAMTESQAVAYATELIQSFRTEGIPRR